MVIGIKTVVTELTGKMLKGIFWIDETVSSWKCELHGMCQNSSVLFTVSKLYELYLHWKLKTMRENKAKIF